jgi:MGT family glycosyltransferase
MRLGFLPPFSPGHLYPTLTLARELRRRGYDVVFFADPAMEDEVGRHGVEVCAFTTECMPAGRTARRHQTLAGLTGRKATCFTMKMFAEFSRDIIRDGERIIRESRVDALVLDALWHNLDIVATHLGVPYVHINCALHADMTGATPFFSYDWPYNPGPVARERNEVGLRQVARCLAPMREVVREYAKKVRLRIELESHYALHSKLAQITQVPKLFDFPSDHLPAHFHYTGPWHDASSRPPVAFPWERLTGEPLIYASMGTLMNGSLPTFQALVAAAESPGRQLVVAIGDQISASQIKSTAKNTVIVNRAPQIELLQRASLCITHAGLNTVLESLSNGVPMVCIPVALDQPGVAARVARLQAGTFIPIADLTKGNLRDAIDTVLQNDIYRVNAERVKVLIGKKNGARLAADIVDQALFRRSDLPIAPPGTNVTNNLPRQSQETLC